MTFSFAVKAIGVSLFCSSLTLGQTETLENAFSSSGSTSSSSSSSSSSNTNPTLTGQLEYDGKYNLTITITNNSTRNLTIPGTNNIFDRQNSIPANTSIAITTLSGQPVRLNGSNYPAPQLSDDVFQDIPGGVQYVRSLNVSNYLLPETASGLALPNDMQSQCFIASLPKFIYALDVTGFTGGETIATYYLSKGLKSVPITSTPYHFNYTVPTSFTPNQAAAIADDANTRRLAEQSGQGTVHAGRRARRRI